ncbi:hypothetical protein [Estrella lausannensis]|uniref:Uncharacterized protein n=1 Tax=Estrella lausannensis TaxID=483423 RepID=A0A0H5DPA6_9BACT|nr:hypothetical protein [Estrella lausannensis]CRX37778.1 conserved hypothetical protein [Estrella lausannensis]
MAGEHPIDDSLNEIEKILNLVSQLKGKDLTNAEVELLNEQLADLESEAQVFEQETEQMLKDIGLPTSRLREALEVIPENVPVDEQDALKKAMKLKEDVLRMKKEMTGDEEFVKEGSPQYLKKKEKLLSKEEHRKKYKRLGSKKKWKPL